MPKRRGAELEDDGDYDPDNSGEDESLLKRGAGSGLQIVRSSRGRPVKVCKPIDSLCSVSCQSLEGHALQRDCPRSRFPGRNAY